MSLSALPDPTHGPHRRHPLPPGPGPSPFVPPRSVTSPAALTCTSTPYPWDSFPNSATAFCAGGITVSSTTPMPLLSSQSMPNRNVLGFLLGTLDHRTHLSHMVRDRQTMASLAVHGIIALVARPQLAARFLRTRALPWCNAAKELFLGCPRDVRTTTSPPRPPADPVAVLAAVAVDPARRGRGIGAELTAGFEAAATQFGTPTAELATHVDTADSASSTSHGFYERLGWTPTRTYLDRDGRRMQVYRRSLGVAAQDGTELT